MNTSIDARGQKMHTRKLLALAAGAGLVFAAGSRAADVHWNVVDGDWDVATNWAGGAVPGAADHGIVDLAGGGTAHVTTDTVDVLGVSVSAGNTISVESGGNLTTLGSDPNDNPANGIHIGDGGTGTAIVTGSGVLATSGGGYGASITVGRGTGTGTLTVDSVGAVVSGNDIHVGGSELPGAIASPGTGTLNISAGSVTARAWTFIGRNGGTGTFNMSGGTYDGNGDFIVGGFGGTGTVHQTGGIVNNNAGWAFVGRTGGSGEYNLSAGEFNVNGNMNVGFEGGTGVFNQMGGTTNFRELPHIGRAGGNGTYNLSGGIMNVGVAGAGSTDDDLVVGADNASTGVLNQTGGAINVTRWGFVGRAGNSGGGTGTVNHSAGTYTSAGWLRIAEAPGSVGTYNLTGTAIANIGGGDADTGDDDVVVGIDPFANGTLKVDDTATLNAARDIVVGLVGGEGKVQQDGGDVNVAGAIFVGHSDSGGGVMPIATYNLTDGTLDVALDLNLGRIDNTSGTLNVSGGTATINGSLVAGLGAAADANPGGNGVVNQSGGTVNAGGVTIAANTGSTGDYNLTGGALNALAMVNNGTFDFTGGTASIGTINGTGTTTVGAGRTLAVNQLRQGSIVVDAGGTATVNPEGGASGTTIVNTLTVNGRLDLTNNDLIVDHDGSVTEDSVRQLVRNGRMAGSTSGIFSTPGTTADDVVLAIVDNGEWGKTSYNGFNIDPTTIVGKYTYFGDSNLDGQVTGDDYLAVDSNLSIGNSWIEGDFNMDNMVTGDDYLAIDTNLGKGTTNPLAFAELKSEMIALHVAMFGEEYLVKLAEVEANGFQVVPEPAALSLLGIGAIGALARRRRRNG